MTNTTFSLGFFVKVELLSEGRVLLKRKTKVMKSSEGQIQWGEVLHLPITNQDQNLQLAVKLYSRGSVRRKHLLGQVSLEQNTELELTIFSMEHFNVEFNFKFKVTFIWFKKTARLWNIKMFSFVNMISLMNWTFKRFEI